MKNRYRTIAYLLLGLTTASFTGCQEYDGAFGDEGINARRNAELILGDSINTYSSWSMIDNYKVKVTANAQLDNITTVEILSHNPFASDEARVLNSTTAKAGDKVTLYYDCPKTLDMVYAACRDDEGHYRIMPFYPGTSEVDFVTWPEERKTRADVTADDHNSTLEIDNLTEPSISVPPRVTNDGQISDNYMFCTKDNLQGRSLADIQKFWHDATGNGYVKDYLYNTSLTSLATDRTETELKEISDVITTTLPERGANTINYIKNTDHYNFTNNCIVTTKEDDGVSITPIHVGAAFANWESIYYYYYPVDTYSKIEGDEAKRVYLRQLPKYKICDINNDFKDTDANWKNVDKTGGQTKWGKTYHLAYFGDGEPNSSTTGKYSFPANYRIGFMLRVDILDDPRSKYYFGSGAWYMAADLYTDDLNEGPNTQGNNGYIGWNDGTYKTADLRTRAAMFTYNGHNYLGFEDEKDHDFNDVVFELAGGKAYEPEKHIDEQVYTYVYEDRKIGDYDMNDCVIKAERINDTSVKLTLVALGGEDRIYLRYNSGNPVFKEDVELHSLFTGATDNIINARAGAKTLECPSETIKVDNSFSFENPGFILCNETRGNDVDLSMAGDDPHGLVIPGDFLYPTEGTCIKDAYPEFMGWAKKRDTNKDWYKHPAEGKTYQKTK